MNNQYFWFNSGSWSYVINKVFRYCTQMASNFNYTGCDISRLFIYVIMALRVIIISFLKFLLSLTSSWSDSNDLTMFIIILLPRKMIFFSEYFFIFISLFSLLFWWISLLDFCDTRQHLLSCAQQLNLSFGGCVPL